MKQAWAGRINSLAQGATQYFAPFDSAALSTSRVVAENIVTIAATLKNMSLVLSAAPGSGKSRTFTLYLNGAATALTFTISDLATSGSDTTHTVSVSPGDLISVQSAVAATPASANMNAFYIEADETNTQYGAGPAARPSVLGSVTTYMGVFDNESSTVEATARDVCPFDGTITALYINVTPAPGTGKSRVFTIMKNGTAQDGTGGTPDTVVTIADSNLTGSKSFSLSVVRGDELSVRSVPVSSPATMSLGMGVALTPSVDGEFLFSVHPGSMSTSAVNYHPLQAASLGWNATESSVSIQYLGTATLALKNLTVGLSGTPGTGKSYTFKVRKDGADTGISVAISDSATTGQSNDTITAVSNAVLCYSCTPSGTPTSRSATLGIVASFGGLLIDKADLQLAGYAPSVLVPVTITVGAGNLAITGQAPSSTLGSGIAAGNLDLVGETPILGVTRIIPVDTAVMVFGGDAPNILLPVGAAAVAFGGLAPVTMAPVEILFPALLLMD